MAWPTTCPPGWPRPPNEEEYLGKNMPQGDGVRRCLFCHTTSFRAVLDQSGPEAADHSIGCEKCHGPGGHHVETMKAGFSDLAIAGSSQDPATEINKVCAECHGFPRSEVLSASRTDPAWYRFQSVALTWSRCYAESDGKLSCVTCHDPHRNADSSTARNEAKCLSCHSAKPSSVSAVRAATPVLSQRKAQTLCPVSPAKGCLQCHMPRVWQQDTHTFKTDHFIRVRDRLVPENK